MSYIYYNPNPSRRKTIDCTIRAICLLTGQDWETVYIGTSSQGLVSHDMPESDAVWGQYLHNLGYNRYFLPNTCPYCYTVKDFCYDHPVGKFLLKTQGHVVAVKDGNYYDTGDCGDEMPVYYWMR